MTEYSVFNALIQIGWCCFWLCKYLLQFKCPRWCGCCVLPPWGQGNPSCKSICLGKHETGPAPTDAGAVGGRRRRRRRSVTPCEEVGRSGATAAAAAASCPSACVWGGSPTCRDGRTGRWSSPSEVSDLGKCRLNSNRNDADGAVLCFLGCFPVCNAAFEQLRRLDSQLVCKIRSL